MKEKSAGIELKILSNKAGELEANKNGTSQRKVRALAGVRMTKLTRTSDRVKDLPRAEMIAGGLLAAFEGGDQDAIRSALSDAVRARGVQDVAKATGLTRAALYKAIGEKGNPKLSTLLAMMKALGVRLSVVT